MKTSNKIIIKNPSEQVVDLMNRLRNHKISQLKKLRDQKTCTFTVNVR